MSRDPWYLVERAGREPMQEKELLKKELLTCFYKGEAGGKGYRRSCSWRWFFLGRKEKERPVRLLKERTRKELVQKKELLILFPRRGGRRREPGDSRCRRRSCYSYL